MPTQRQIERFTLAFHREALKRLRAEPRLRAQAAAVLDRWEAQGVTEHAKVYRDRWRALLGGGFTELEAAVCAETDEAATLRSMSPLGFTLAQDERLKLRQEAMAE